MLERPELSPAVANDLALAVIQSSTGPLVLLDGNLVIIAASASFSRVFGLKMAELPGHMLADIGAGEWDIPQLATLLRATASGSAAIDAYEIELRRSGHAPMRLVLNAKKLSYGPGREVRLLLSASDVTAARIAEKDVDDALRDNAFLMQELQHRVANSLQIIASLLLQSARNVQSDESRLHLHDAHNRVMSIAALQRHLAITRTEEVELRTYLTELCGSIAASMILDPTQIALVVQVDDTVTTPEDSVSLGLVTTELVINALKHAFPDHRNGKVTIAYRREGLDWRLSVIDDGVGIAVDRATVKPGLGTNIVQALAKQLQAEVVVEDARPGVAVLLMHKAAQTQVNQQVI